MSQVLITGGERGIGRAVATRLLSEGHHVIITWIDGHAATKTARELARYGDNLTMHQLDVTDDENISRTFSTLEIEVESLDILVNNAGVVEEASATELTRDHLRRIFDVNTFGPALVTKAALPLLARSPSAQIVNVSSGGGSLTKASGLGTSAKAVIPAYAASKAALNMLTIQTDILLRQHAEWSHIRINAVSPGATATLIGGYEGQPVESAAALICSVLGDQTIGTRRFLSAKGEYPW